MNILSYCHKIIDRAGDKFLLISIPSSPRSLERKIRRIIRLRAAVQALVRRAVGCPELAKLSNTIIRSASNESIRP